MDLKPGQRLEPIIYYCDLRKKKYKRNVIIDDELDIRRKLCGTVLLLKTAWNQKQYLMLQSVNGHSARHVGTGSKSLPAYLFGQEHVSARRTTDDIWNITRESYGIEKEVFTTEPA